MFGMFGFQQYTYVSDTVLGGLTGHRIDGSGATSYQGFPDVDTWYTPAAYITAQDHDVILVWSNTDQQWDTLFWTGAVPGDGWVRADGVDGACDPADSIVVIDTSTVVVDGIPLRKWTIDQRWGGFLYNNIQDFVERIGWYWNFLPFPACIAVDGPSGMRCYSDQDISISYVPYGCESLLGIAGTAENNGYLVSPDPGDDHFTIELRDGSHELQLIDALGRSVARLKSSGRTTVNTSDLQPGCYWVKVDGRLCSRWIKAVG
jgi:hypothetical protein